MLLTLVVFGLFAAGMLGMAAMTGSRPRTKGASKRSPYESGMPIVDTATRRIPVKFYLVALVFVVLDVEVAFLYPWAINFRDQLSNGPVVALLEILIFVAPLATVFTYIWRKGVFDWSRGSGRGSDQRSRGRRNPGSVKNNPSGIVPDRSSRSGREGPYLYRQSHEDESDEDQ